MSASPDNESAVKAVVVLLKAVRVLLKAVRVLAKAIRVLVKALRAVLWIRIRNFLQDPDPE